MTTQAAGEVVRDRFVVTKESGSRFAYVNDTEEGRTVKRYDTLRHYGGMDGWTVANMHANQLNQAARKALGGDS